MLSGTAGEHIPGRGHRPRHRRPDDLAIFPIGDVAGQTYEELYVEHAPAARRAALSMVPRDVADDIVAEAFTRVLGAIRAGGGPGLAFRAYLLTAVRNTASDWLRASRRTTVVGDLGEGLEDRVPEENMGVARLSRGPEAEAEARAEARLVTRAFAHLPARWRAVLWQLEVEGEAPAAVAPMFGLSANGVSALAVRAREGLRQAYLREHIGSNISASCRSYAEALGADARGRLSRRRRSAVHEHLEHCPSCYALATELTDVNSRLGAILAPAALAGAGAKAGAGLTAGAGLRAGAAARRGGRAWLSGHVRLHSVAAVASAAAGLAAAGGMVVAVSVSPYGPGGGPGGSRPAGPPAGVSPSGPSASGRVRGAASPLGSASSLAPGGGASGTGCPGSAGVATRICTAGRPGANGTTASPGTRSAGPGGPGGAIGTVTKGVGSTLGGTLSGTAQVVPGVTQVLGTVLGPEAGGAAGGAAGGTVKNAGSTVSGVTGRAGTVAGHVSQGAGGLLEGRP